MNEYEYMHIHFNFVFYIQMEKQSFRWDNKKYKTNVCTRCYFRFIIFHLLNLKSVRPYGVVGSIPDFHPDCPSLIPGKIRDWVSLMCILSCAVSEFYWLQNEGGPPLYCLVFGPQHPTPLTQDTFLQVPGDMIPINKEDKQ